jgi:ATP/maltotriose-dependent transcriptional regulator MalT
MQLLLVGIRRVSDWQEAGKNWAADMLYHAQLLEVKSSYWLVRGALTSPSATRRSVTGLYLVDGL